MLASLNHVRTVEVARILEMDLHAHVVAISAERHASVSIVQYIFFCNRLSYDIDIYFGIY